MHTIKYKLKKIYDKIYLIEAKKFDLGMIFFRVQEFYENPKYKNKRSTFWDLMSYYALQDGCFDYADDYIGFNVPSRVVDEFLKGKVDVKTPWDIEFENIVSKIRGESDHYYLIGVRKNDENTLQHELAHAFYNINPEYKKRIDKLILECFTPKQQKKIFEELSQFKYHRSVFKDELQAYTIDKHAPESLNKLLKKHRSKFRRVFLKYRGKK